MYTPLVNSTPPSSEQSSDVGDLLATALPAIPAQKNGTPLGFGWDPFARIWDSVLTERPDVRALLGASLSGAMLVDLGAGQHYAAAMYPIALALGVTDYIPVDLHFPSDTERTLQRQVRADMLEYLRSLPDGSCCVVMNGIDRLAIRDSEYHRSIATEIRRVIKPSGVAFGVFSEALNYPPEVGWRILSSGNITLEEQEWQVLHRPR